MSSHLIITTSEDTELHVIAADIPEVIAWCANNTVLYKKVRYYPSVYVRLSDAKSTKQQALYLAKLRNTRSIGRTEPYFHYCSILTENADTVFEYLAENWPAHQLVELEVEKSVSILAATTKDTKKLSSSNIDFSHRLKECRKARRLTQLDLAELSGLHSTTICHFETGARKPDFDNLCALVKALDTSADYLLGTDNKR